MRDLLLINPRTENVGLSATPTMRIPPLNLRVIKALTDEDRYNVTIVDEFQEPVEPYLDGNVDLVGITAMTPAAPRAYQIARMAKEREIPTILGGIHATVLPEEAANFVDCVVTGEVEPIWGGILNDFENGGLRPRYDAGILQDMSRVPIVSKADGYRLPFTTQTARGCPIGCDFCSVTSVNGAAVRGRPIEDVITELKMAREAGVKYFAFVDDNIVAPGKKYTDRSIDLFKRLAEEDLGMQWASQTSINFGNNPEALYWAERSGCKGVFIGFESINDATLKERRKAFNIKHMHERTGFLDPVKRIHDYGIAILGGFIFGSDNDDEGVYDRTKEFVFDARLDATQYSILTPLPGTRIFSAYERTGRLLFTDFPGDWKKYDVQTPVIRPKGMSVDQFVDRVNGLYRDTNSLLPAGGRAVRTLMNTSSPVTTAVMFLTNKGYWDQWRNFRDTLYQRN